MSLPRISVISIFYNEAAHIAEAVDSVLAQDFADFELLLVDDGSVDESSALAKAYAAAYPDRIRYLEHPGHANLGMSASRNAGLAAARGELIAFIDADDRWRTHKLREQVALLDRMPDVDAVGGSVNYWESHIGGKDRVVPTGHARDRPILPGEATTKFYPLGRAHAPSMSDLLFRRASIERVGGFEVSFKGAYEDQAFLGKFYLESTLYLTNAVWSDYRIHPSSCMATAHRDGTYRKARRAYLEWFENYLERTRFSGDEAIKRALRKALSRSAPTSRRARAAAAVKTVLPERVTKLVQTAKSAVRNARPKLMPGPAILMYHRVANESFDPWGLAVSPQNFADQVDWIARNRTVLPLAEFARLHERGSLPRNAVALTFDDGYLCNKDVAAPVLERLKIPSTIFLPVELIERGREFWWDELERIVLGHEGEYLRLYGHQIRVGPKQPDDSDWVPAQPPGTPRQKAYHRLWSLLYERPHGELESGMAELRQQSHSPDKPRTSHRPMKAAELAAIGSSLVDFGSHSLQHASLPLLDRQAKSREIFDSFARCAALTGTDPTSFAYPYGDVDAESMQLVAEAGYQCACRADGWFVSRRTSKFALPRIFVGNWNSARLAKQLGRPSRRGRSH